MDGAWNKKEYGSRAAESKNSQARVKSNSRIGFSRKKDCAEELSTSIPDDKDFHSRTAGMLESTQCHFTLALHLPKRKSQDWIFWWAMPSTRRTRSQKEPDPQDETRPRSRNVLDNYWNQIHLVRNCRFSHWSGEKSPNLREGNFLTRNCSQYCSGSEGERINAFPVP